MKIIIDSNGLAYRSLYSMGSLSHNNSPTGIIYGFLKEVLSLSEKFQTNQFIFAWDSRQSYRKMIDPEYKGNRNSSLSEEDIKTIKQAHTQFDLLRLEILPAMGFKRNYIQSGYEADDLIAEIVYRHPDDYIIATGDEDLFQLLKNTKNSIEIYNLSKKIIITEEDFTKKYGIKPIDWATVKAIGGCNSDNVKGIPGVGPESAIKYLNGVLKEGSIKKKIESEIGKQITIDCMRFVHLPFLGDREINIIEDREIFYNDEIFNNINFMSVFRQYGCQSFATESGLNKWREAFKL